MAKHFIIKCSVLQCAKLSFMIKNLEKCREGMILNFSNLVLKRYGKWFLKTCGNPGLLLIKAQQMYKIAVFLVVRFILFFSVSQTQQSPCLFGSKLINMLRKLLLCVFLQLIPVWSSLHRS